MLRLLTTMTLSYGLMDITAICSRPYFELCLSLATRIARPEQQSMVFFGPLVFPPPVHPPALPALLPHVDDGMFLAPQFQESTFEQRAQLLYLNWRVLHAVDALHDIKTWLHDIKTIICC